MSFYGQISRQYDFIPFKLRVRPGTNGDGGISFAPGIMPTNPQNPILKSPLSLTSPGDLGTSGDLITDWDTSNWATLAVVDGRSTPAILAANYGEEGGQVAYVTNQLAPFPKLVYDLLAWHFDGSQNRTIKIAVMIESMVPPEQILNDWDGCFQEVATLASENRTSWNIQYSRIRVFQLNNLDLNRFDVLVLAVGWGDGYFSTGWNWNIHQGGAAARRFVGRGGLLLLPEAGFYDDYGFWLGDRQIVFPVAALEASLSSQANAFAMAGASLSGIGFLYTIKKDYLTEPSYAWITMYLFLVGFIWFMVPIFFSGNLWAQTSVVLTATVLDGVAIFSALVAIVLRQIHSGAANSTDP